MCDIVLHMAFCSIRMTEEEKKLLEEYARINGKSISDVLRESFMEKLEDEFDVKSADEAYALFLKDPVTVSSEDMMRKYGL